MAGADVERSAGAESQRRAGNGPARWWVPLDPRSGTRHTSRTRGAPFTTRDSLFATSGREIEVESRIRKA
jgi:hypothetical protein